MGINVATARDSDFGRFLLSRLGLEEEGYQRWMQQFGFDPRHDLQSIVIATSPNGDQDPNVVVLARGAFDVQKVTAKAKAKGVTVEPYEGVDIFLNARNPDRHGFAFLGNDLVVLGGAAGIRDVVGNRTHTWSISQQLQDASTLAAADNDVWFASAGPVAPLTRYLPG